MSGNKIVSATIKPFLEEYNALISECDAMSAGAPKPLDAEQTGNLISKPKAGSSDSERLVDLLSHRVPPGVDEEAYVKATYLSALATGAESNPLISRARAVELLRTMQGEYDVSILVDLLKDGGGDSKIAKLAAKQLLHTLLVSNAFYDMQAIDNKGGGNVAARQV